MSVGMCIFLGVKVRIVGHQANASEAPILVLAPHSSIFDFLPLMALGAPTIVAKKSLAENYLFGSERPKTFHF